MSDLTRATFFGIDQRANHALWRGPAYRGASPRVRKEHWGRQAAIGLGFGAALWLVNFQIIARILYPWFLNAPQFLQMMMHAVFFGLPLALMYAGAERRVHHIRGAPSHA